MNERDRLAAVLTVVAIVSVVAGVAWWLNPAAALIAFGIMCAALALLLTATEPDTILVDVEGEGE